MANWNKATLTNVGKALQARVNAGEGPLKIVAVSIGSGTPPANLETATNLAHKEMDVQISGTPTAEDNVVAIDGMITNANVTKAFNITELGIFAQLGDDATTKVLYSIQTDPNPDNVPAYGGATAYSQAFYLRQTVSNLDNVQVEVNTTAFVTNKQLQDHDTNPDAHTAAFAKHLRVSATKKSMSNGSMWARIVEV